MIIAAIGNDQQRLLRILRLPHLAHAHVDRIQQRRALLRHGEDQLALNVVHRTGEIVHHLGLVGERDHEEFVLRIGSLEKLDHRIFRAVHFAAHASAGIEDHSQRHRRVLARERLDLLFCTAFEKLEVVLVQPGHQTVHRICNRHRHQHQIDRHFQGTRTRIQRCGNHALLRDFFRLRFLPFEQRRFVGRLCLTGNDVDIVHIGLPHSRYRQAASRAHQHRKRRPEQSPGSASTQTHKSWVPGSNQVGVPN